jgi:hypothetical protein
MNTAVTKSPRAVRPILLLRGLPTRAKLVDRPTTRPDFRPLHCLPTLLPSKFPPGLYDLAIAYPEILSLPSALPIACLT